MIKRIIDKSGNYYEGMATPTGTEFCRIMQAIAVKNKDKLYDVFPESVDPLNTGDNLYRGKINGYQYNTDDDVYEFLVEEMVNYVDSEALHLFIGMRLYTISGYSQYDEYVRVADADDSLYLLMKDAENEGNLTSVKGTIWGEYAGEIIMDYKANWSTQSKKEVLKDEFRKTGIKDSDNNPIDTWKVLKKTTGMELTAGEDSAIIIPQTGIAMIEGKSKFAPYYVSMDFHDITLGAKQFTMRIYLGTTDINLESLPEYTTEPEQYWACVTSVELQLPFRYTIKYQDRFSENTYYDGDDFLDSDPSSFRTPEKIRLFRMKPQLKIPLIFTEAKGYKIKQYGYYNADGTNIAKMASFALSTSTMNPHVEYIHHFLYTIDDTIIYQPDLVYTGCKMGYYGRYSYNDLIDDDYNTNFMSRSLASLLKDITEDIYFPGLIQNNVLVEKDGDDDTMAIDVEEANGKITFDFNQIYRFDFESGDLEDSVDAPFFFWNNVLKKNKIESILVKSVYIENPYLKDAGDKEIFVDKDDVNGDLYYTFDEDSAIVLASDYTPGDDEMDIGGVTTTWEDKGYIFVEGLKYEYDINSDGNLDITDPPSPDRKALESSKVYNATNIIYNGRKVGELVSIDDIDVEFTPEDDIPDEDLFENESLLYIDNELIEVDWSPSSDEGDNLVLKVNERGVRGTTRADHVAGVDIKVYDYLKKDEAIRKNNYNVDYSGKYKAKIILNKTNTGDYDIGNTKIVYIVEVKWML